jgi:prepilin-type N-terminal cleavage/methylation domain-containing protein
MHIQSYKLRSNGAGLAGKQGLFLVGQRAFTLAEVLVAVFVIAVVTLSLYAGLGTGFMLIDSAREDLRATQILTQKAEAIRLCTYSSLSNCPISFVERYDPSNTNNSMTGTTYSGTITTNVPAQIPDTAAYKTNMCLATITINWTNYYGKPTAAHSRTMQTLVARYGIQNYIWGTVP